MYGSEKVKIMPIHAIVIHFILCIKWAGALVQWLKLRAWKGEDCGLEPLSGL